MIIGLWWCCSLVLVTFCDRVLGRSRSSSICQEALGDEFRCGAGLKWEREERESAMSLS